MCNYTKTFLATNVNAFYTKTRLSKGLLPYMEILKKCFLKKSIRKILTVQKKKKRKSKITRKIDNDRLRDNDRQRK